MQSFMLSSKCAQFFCLEPLLRSRVGPTHPGGNDARCVASLKFKVEML